jgi:cytochrome c
MICIDAWRAAALLACLGACAARAQAPEGRGLFAQCAACHATDAKPGPGPGLQGVFGRVSGTAAGFRYSPAMKRAGLRWDEAALDAFLADPQKAVPGNLMPYSGLPSAAERASLIAYLKSFGAATP